jgi:hypothetical protein
MLSRTIVLFPIGLPKGSVSLLSGLQQVDRGEVKPLR